jgi:hypothetical protein
MRGTFITFGIVTSNDHAPEVACRIIATYDEADAITIAEALGNEPGTTIAYTDEALVALACERPDYIDKGPE